MRKFALATAIATMTIASPAYAAGEGRVEARGGIAFAQGTEEAFAGIAAGYDFHAGEKGFLGIEGSVEKVLQKGADEFYTAAVRAGVRTNDKTKLYALGGIGFANGGSDFIAGAGVQRKFGSKAYGKIEYRRSFGFVDVNFAGVGLGIAF
jgi:outer membrane immunogenic protein